MRLTIGRRALLDAMDAIAWVRTAKAVRPYDGQMLIETKRGGIVDLTLREEPYHARASVDAAVVEEGVVVVPYDTLRGWLEACSASTIDVRAGDAGATLRSTLGWTKLRGPEERDFPRRAFVHSLGESLATTAVREVVKAVLYAMADDGHPLAYVDLRFRTGGTIEARAASTACRAIATRRMTGDRPRPNREWIAPARLAKTLASDRFTHQAEILIAATTSGLWVAAGGAEISGPALDRVDWDVPTHLTTAECAVNRADLVSAVRMLRSICVGGEFAGVVVEIDKGKLTLTLDGTAHADARNSLNATMTGAPARVIVGIGALEDSASNACGDAVALTFGSETDPLGLRAQADGFETAAYVQPRVPDVV
jgi:DNA polymerase III sliding clamp (beta) subunit (PCNA family)